MSILKIDFLHDAVKFELEGNVNNAEFKGVLRKLRRKLPVKTSYFSTSPKIALSRPVKSGSAGSQSVTVESLLAAWPLTGFFLWAQSSPEILGPYCFV